MAKSALQKLAEATVATFERQETRPNVAFQMTRAELIDEDDRKLDWDIFPAVTSAPLKLTITGASTIQLVCEDPEFELLNDPIFAGWMFENRLVSKSSAKTYTGRKITNASKTAKYGEEAEEEWILPERPIDLNLDGVWFRLAGFRVAQTTLTLTFEDRIAAILRTAPGFTTAIRGKYTRAQFIEKNLNEAEREKHNYGKLARFIPEAKITQPVSLLAPAEQAGDLTSGSARAITSSDGVTVKNLPANAGQLKILNIALATAVELKAPFRAQVALIAALIDENTVSNPDPGTAADLGVLSMTAETAHSKPSVNPFNIVDPCTVFLKEGFTGQGGAIDLCTQNSRLGAGEIAHIVQGNRDPAAVTYDKYVAEAEHAVRVYGGNATGEGSSGTVPGPYPFTRGPDETYWDCIQRLASEVGWYAFVRDNTLWYVSGEFLFSQRAQMHVERGTKGVDWVNPNIDIGARDRIAEIEVLGRAALWTAVAGHAVQVARVGPANGKWVLDTVTLDVMDLSDAITAKLQKPLPPRPEPAAQPAEEEQLEGSGASGGVAGYVNPFQRIKNLGPAGLDKGVDFSGSGPIVAVGDATVYFATQTASWPGGGFVGYTLNSGPHKGKHIYHAENLKITVKEGDKIKAGQTVAILTNAYPYSESGWGTGSGENTLAAQLGQPRNSAAGASFNRFLVKLGCVSGGSESSAVGTMPGGYP